MLLTYTRTMIRFSNCGGLSQMGISEIHSIFACWVMFFFLLLLLSADFFHFFFVQNIFQEHSSTVKRFGSRPGPFGFKLFANVISRREKSPLASKELNVRAFFFKECTFLSLVVSLRYILNCVGKCTDILRLKNYH